jgi:hypothetical protein
MPVPVLVVRAVERYITSTGTTYTAYRFRVVNASAIPDSFFVGPYTCDPARVALYNGDNDSLIYEWCGGGIGPSASRNSLFESYSLFVGAGVSPPSRVYLVLTNAGTGERFTSTTARLPARPSPTANAITSAIVETVDCRPAATPDACKTIGDPNQPALEVRTRVTYSYDGAYKEPRLVVHLQAAEGVCLVFFTARLSPSVGTAVTSLVRSAIDPAATTDCRAKATIKDRITGILVCLEDAQITTIETICREFEYDRAVTFARN